MAKKQLKTPEQIALMRQSAQLVSKTLGELSKHVQPGVTPLQLDAIAYAHILDHGATPGFLGLYGFPNTLCMSRNEQIVHGIPDDVPLKEGDVISIDCGVKWNGYCGDQAYTFAVGEVSEAHLHLLRATRTALDHAIEAIQPGARIGNIGHAIQQYIYPLGYGIVKELVGHGIGKDMHEPPNVPNYGKRGTGVALRTGMVLAIEPMITLGSARIRKQADGWTIETADKQFAAHYEHDVAINENGVADVLSTFDYIIDQQQIPPLEPQIGQEM